MVFKAATATSTKKLSNYYYIQEDLQATVFSPFYHAPHSKILLSIWLLPQDYLSRIFFFSLFPSDIQFI